jgi:hypothetical protein
MPTLDRIETGRVYRLRTATLGSMLDSQQRPVTVTIPRGTALKVATTRRGDPMVEMLWDGEAVKIFAVDLCERGELVSSASVGA